MAMEKADYLTPRGILRGTPPSPDQKQQGCLSQISRIGSGSPQKTPVSGKVSVEGILLSPCKGDANSGRDTLQATVRAYNQTQKLLEEKQRECNELRELQPKLEAAQAEIEKLKEENRAAKEEATEWQNLLEAEEAETIRLKSEILEAAQAEIRKLKEENHAAKEEATEWQNLLEAEEAETTRLKSETNRLAAKVANLTDELQELNAEISKLRKESETNRLAARVPNLTDEPQGSADTSKLRKESETNRWAGKVANLTDESEELSAESSKSRKAHVARPSAGRQGTIDFDPDQDERQLSVWLSASLESLRAELKETQAENTQLRGKIEEVAALPSVESLRSELKDTKVENKRLRATLEEVAALHGAVLEEVVAVNGRDQASFKTHYRHDLDTWPPVMSPEPDKEKQGEGERRHGPQYFSIQSARGLSRNETPQKESEKDGLRNAGGMPMARPGSDAASARRSARTQANLQDILSARRMVVDKNGESFEGGGVPVQKSRLRKDSNGDTWTPIMTPMNSMEKNSIEGDGPVQWTSTWFKSVSSTNEESQEEDQKTKEFQIKVQSLRHAQCAQPASEGAPRRPDVVPQVPSGTEEEKQHRAGEENLPSWLQGVAQWWDQVTNEAGEHPSNPEAVTTHEAMRPSLTLHEAV